MEELKLALEKFLEHEEDCVRSTAAAVLEMYENVDMGTMSKDEMKEIIDDIITLDKIDELADGIDRKKKIHTAFQTIKLVVMKFLI